jgi:putative hemolysin
MFRSPSVLDRVPPPLVESGYHVSFATSSDDVAAVTRLRFEVFNLELGEGLAASFATGHDRDAFDDVCDHLLVREAATGRAVGTYRLQTCEQADAGLGFYSASEFRLDDLPADLRRSSVEVGRACVARDFRNRRVLFLLWKGLAAYMTHRRKRFLFGCCSVATTDVGDAWAYAKHLEDLGAWHGERRVRAVRPLAHAPAATAPMAAPELPSLFRSYLRFGATVCGGPVIDAAFGTTDFLVVLDLHQLSPEASALFFKTVP